MANALLNAPAQPAAKKVLQPLAESSLAQAAKKVLQPLAELLPAQAAAAEQLSAPAQAANSIQTLAENQTVKVIPTHIGDGVDDRVHVGAVAVLKSLHHHADDERSCAQRHRHHRQPRKLLAELQHQWSQLQPLAENQTVKVIPTHIGDGVDRVHAQPKKKR